MSSWTPPPPGVEGIPLAPDIPSSLSVAIALLTYRLLCEGVITDEERIKLNAFSFPNETEVRNELCATFVQKLCDEYRATTTKIKRPPNSWVVFLSNYRHQIDTCLGRPVGNYLHISHVSKLASQNWKRIGVADRALYEAASEALKQAHKEAFPTYTYSPQRKATNTVEKSVKRKTDDAEHMDGSSAATDVGDHTASFTQVPQLKAIAERSGSQADQCFPARAPYEEYTGLGFSTMPSRVNATIAVPSLGPTTEFPIPFFNWAGPSPWEQAALPLSMQTSAAVSSAQFGASPVYAPIVAASYHQHRTVPLHENEAGALASGSNMLFVGSDLKGRYSPNKRQRLNTSSRPAFKQLAFEQAWSTQIPETVRSISGYRRTRLPTAAPRPPLLDVMTIPTLPSLDTGSTRHSTPALGPPSAISSASSATSRPPPRQPGVVQRSDQNSIFAGIMATTRDILAPSRLNIDAMDRGEALLREYVDLGILESL